MCLIGLNLRGFSVVFGCPFSDIMLFFGFLSKLFRFLTFNLKLFYLTGLYSLVEWENGNSFGGNVLMHNVYGKALSKPTLKNYTNLTLNQSCSILYIMVALDSIWIDSAVNLCLFWSFLGITKSIGFQRQ